MCGWDHLHFTCLSNEFKPLALKMYQMACITSDYIYTPVFLLTELVFFFLPCN